MKIFGSNPAYAETAMKIFYSNPASAVKAMRFAASLITMEQNDSFAATAGTDRVEHWPTPFGKQGLVLNQSQWPSPSGEQSSMDALDDEKECANCHTKVTSLWRRNSEGKRECNACRLYFRETGRTRPRWMRTDKIVRRHRISKYDLMMSEIPGSSTNFTHHQNVVPYHHTSNFGTSFESSIAHESTIKFYDPNQTVARKFPAPSSVFTQPFPSFNSCSTHHSNGDSLMMMNRPTEQAMVNFANMTQRPRIDDQANFSKYFQLPFPTLPSDIFDQHVHAADANINVY